jgi:hypothetical protein
LNLGKCVDFLVYKICFRMVNLGDRYAKEDLHRAKAYERDLTTQRKNEARRAEEGREAADRGRMAGAYNRPLRCFIRLN